MLNQEARERLAEYIVNKIEEQNVYIYKKIGNTIKTIGNINPSQAYQLQQILKYGGSYEQISKEISKVSGKNIQDIYKIFDEVAKDNKEFAKQFYRYRGIDFIPYARDYALKQQVKAIADITAKTYMNIANTSGIGFLFEDINGQMTFKNIQQSYYEIVDRGILAISQGKSTYQEEMRKIINDIGNNGVVLYESGRTRRLDSAVRMNILDGIRRVSMETSKRYGEQYRADGIEISVHSNPAPDHADIQGRQFSKEDFERLENGQIALDYQGNRYSGYGRRHIGEYNCYHDIFNIVLGVSKPEYTDKELRKIQADNERGFEYDGKHYTMYEGTQLQRRIETEIRKQKDKQILAKASGDKELTDKAQKKITQLTHKYNDLCKTSGLLPKKQRMSVSNYRRIKI